MGLFKGSTTLSQYKTDRPGQLRDLFGDLVPSHTFAEIEGTTDEIGSGWVRPDDFMGTDLSYSTCSMEPYVLLGLRIDRRKVPAILLKKYIAHETQGEKLKQEMGGGKARLGRALLNTLKERARTAALRRTPPVPTVVDVIWNTETGAIWLGSTTRLVWGVFESLFAKTFQVIPRFEFPARVGLRLLDGTEERKALSNEMPAGEMTAVQAATFTAWIGQEFLTWLLYSASADSSNHEETLWLDETCGVSLISQGIGGGQITFSQPEDGMQDLRHAIHGGRVVNRLTLYMELDQEHYRATLDAWSLGISGLKLPPMENRGDDWQGQTLERIALTERFIGALHDLFKEWLLLRFGDELLHAAIKDDMNGWAEGWE